MAVTVNETESERDLQSFVERAPEEGKVAIRTLAHAWAHAGGTLVIGKQAIRLTAQETAVSGDAGDADASRPFTAATLYADRKGSGPSVELARALLSKHGIRESTWQDWCDEHEALCAHGFQPAAKYPAVSLGALPPTEVLRLAVGLRDLHLAIQQA